MIVRMTPWSMRLQTRGRSVTVEGEMRVHPDHGSRDFYAAGSAVRFWDDGTPIDPDDRMEVLHELEAAATAVGLTVEVELWGPDVGAYLGLYRLSQVR